MILEGQFQGGDFDGDLPLTRDLFEACKIALESSYSKLRDGI